MKQNATPAIKLILKHEGGWANHPNDPGGATNRGVTIGTLKGLGMDLDGDGDVDIADLKALTENDAVKIYKRFYWDKVEGDLLPSGVDYAVADFAVNSGPKRAAQYLQRIVGVTDDGDIGPMTMTAVMAMDSAEIITRLCDNRLAFMKRIQGGALWKSFGRGWASRVAGVRSVAIEWATAAPAPVTAPDSAPQPQGGTVAIIAAIAAAFVAIFRKGKS